MTSLFGVLGVYLLCSIVFYCSVCASEQTEEYPPLDSTSAQEQEENTKNNFNNDNNNNHNNNIIDKNFDEDSFITELFQKIELAVQKAEYDRVFELIDEYSSNVPETHKQLRRAITEIRYQFREMLVEESELQKSASSQSGDVEPHLQPETEKQIQKNEEKEEREEEEEEGGFEFEFIDAEIEVISIDDVGNVIEHATNINNAIRNNEQNKISISKRYIDWMTPRYEVILLLSEDEMKANHENDESNTELHNSNNVQTAVDINYNGFQYRCRIPSFTYIAPDPYIDINDNNKRNNEHQYSGDNNGGLSDNDSGDNESNEGGEAMMKNEKDVNNNDDDELEYMARVFPDSPLPYHHYIDLPISKEIRSLFFQLFTTCFYQNIETEGIEYIYRFCPGNNLHRAVLRSKSGKAVNNYLNDETDAPIDDDSDDYDIQKSLSSSSPSSHINSVDERTFKKELKELGLKVKDVEMIGKLPSHHKSVFGIVENSVSAYYVFSSSTFIYQWYGESLRVEHHCGDKATIMNFFPIAFDVYVLQFSTPAVCRLPLLKHVHQKTMQISCLLLDPPPHSHHHHLHESSSGDPPSLFDYTSHKEIDGDWLIFDVGKEYTYNGHVTFSILSSPFINSPYSKDTESKIELSVLPQPPTLFTSEDDHPHPPSLVRTLWTLGNNDYYVGMGLYSDNNACVSWSNSLIPSVSMFRIVDNSTLVEYWWDPSDKGFGIAYKIPSSSSSSSTVKAKNDQKLGGDYLLFSSFIDAADIMHPMSRTAVVSIAKMPHPNKFMVTWKSTMFERHGLGILSDDFLCVAWRDVPEKNDGIVHYRFEGNKVFGLWSLYQMMGLRKEDLLRKIN